MSQEYSKVDMPSFHDNLNEAIDKTEQIIQLVKTVKGDFSDLQGQIGCHLDDLFAFRRINTIVGQCVQRSEQALIAAVILRDQHLELKTKFERRQKDFKEAYGLLRDIKLLSKVFFETTASIKRSIDEINRLAESIPAPREKKRSLFGWLFHKIGSFFRWIAGVQSSREKLDKSHSDLLNATAGLSATQGVLDTIVSYQPHINQTAYEAGSVFAEFERMQRAERQRETQAYTIHW